MPSTFTSRTKLELQAAGENLTTWGQPKLNNDFVRVDFAVKGVVSFSLSGTKTLTSTTASTTDPSQYENIAAVLNITSGTGGTVIVPALEAVWQVRNGTTGSVIISNGSNSVTIPSQTGSTVVTVFTDGVNIYRTAPETAAQTVTTGQWTPVVSLAVPGTSSFAYSARTGTWRRTGDLVVLEADISVTPTVGTGSGAVRISGYPYPPNSANYAANAIRSLSADFTWPAGATSVAVAFIDTGALGILARGASLSNVFFQASSLGATAHTLRFRMEYTAA